jgi:hypothetical protein
MWEMARLKGMQYRPTVKARFGQKWKQEGNAYRYKRTSGRMQRLQCAGFNEVK